MARPRPARGAPPPLTAARAAAPTVKEAERNQASTGWGGAESVAGARGLFVSATICVGNQAICAGNLDLFGNASLESKSWVRVFRSSLPDKP